MEIVITSLVDLKKSQHNRPHEFVKYLSKNHNITVLSINDWWKGNQDDHEKNCSDFGDIFEKIDYRYNWHTKHFCHSHQKYWGQYIVNQALPYYHCQ